MNLSRLDKYASFGYFLCIPVSKAIDKNTNEKVKDELQLQVHSYEMSAGSNFVDPNRQKRHL